MKRNSLSNKFLPFTLIKTEAILVMDDDLIIKQSVILKSFRSVYKLLTNPSKDMASCDV